MTAPETDPSAVAPLELGFSDEQDQLLELARGFLAEQSSEEHVRALMSTDSGFDAAIWSRMAEEVGLAGLIIPEDLGGAGLSGIELGIVMEEMGRALYCGPFLSTAVMATTALIESDDDDAKAELLPAIAAGHARIALAIDGLDGTTAVIRARSDGDVARLDGTMAVVVDGAHADSILVVAAGEHGVGLFHVEGDADELGRVAIPGLDETRKLARLDFSNTPARALASDVAGIERARDRIITALACEQLGGAQRCLDMAVEYARERIQFGRPIGSFQSIKHKCADLLIGIEAAKSAARYAAACSADAPDHLPIAASMARARCSDVFVRAAEDNLQIHGGIGFTWEHACHLYLKRARSSAVLFGDALHHRERVAALVGI